MEQSSHGLTSQIPSRDYCTGSQVAIYRGKSSKTTNHGSCKIINEIFPIQNDIGYSDFNCKLNYRFQFPHIMILANKTHLLLAFDCIRWWRRLLLHCTAPAIYETWCSQSTGIIHGLLVRPVTPIIANQRLYKASLIECHTVNYSESFINVCMSLLSHSFASSS